jgi:hypothetical protein
MDLRSVLHLRKDSNGRLDACKAMAVARRHGYLSHHE